MGEGVWREILFGLRQFRRSPGLAAGVALTMTARPCIRSAGSGPLWRATRVDPSRALRAL
jgi:hypothetical protein